MIEDAAELSARFDFAFSRAVTEVWLRKPDLFQSLTTLLSAPGLTSSSFELQWLSYRQKLIYDFEVRPMFGQELSRISLSQAYIPLRCAWKEKVKHSSGFEIDNQRHDYLDDFLIEWIDRGVTAGKDPDDLRLIGGGPGSGKSTSMRKLVRTLADRASIRPLFIPLQHIDLEGNLRDAINSYFTSRTRGSFTSPPLSREALEDGSRLLLVFDGLDEIARPGEGANEVANLFITKLDQLQSSLQGDTSQCPKCIVTGRLPSFQAAKKFRGALGEAAMEVMGYAEIDKKGGVEGSEISRVGQRSLWWLKYAAASGQSEVIPQALIDPRLTEVTNEPLLYYLLVLSGYVLENWELAANNRNLIYQRLIDEVWRRGWGETGRPTDRQGPGKHLSKQSFNDLMETIALAAWLGGDTRVATEDAFQQTVRITHAEAAWEEFKLDGGEDVANLAMNFYLKASDGVNRGFEFTHKSFGDYLTARAIIKLARETAAFVPRHIDLALTVWLKGTSTGTLSIEILNYIRDEMRIYISDELIGFDQISSLFKPLETLARTILDEGLPAHSISPKNWRGAARMQRNSEIMLWGVLNSCVRNLQGADKTIIKVGFETNKILFKSFLVRLLIADGAGAPMGQCLSYIDASNSQLFGLELSKSDISFGKFQNATFSGCHLMEVNMRNCDLSSVKIQRTNLDRCRLSGSIVEGLQLTDARLIKCNPFEGTTGKLSLSVRTLLDWPQESEIPEDRVKVNKGFEDPGTWDERLLRAQNLHIKLLEAEAELERVDNMNIENLEDFEE